MSTTLWTFLGQVHDRRSRQGQRYKLRPLLALSIGALLGGCSSLGAIAQWIGEVARRDLLKEFGIERGRPCHATLHYFFSNLNIKSLERALAKWVKAAGCEEEVQIALDGKTVRGSGLAGYQGAHMLAAYCEKLNGVVGQMQLEPGMNEITAALRLIKEIDLKDAVVTGDAMFCQRSLSKAVLKKNGNYVFPVKDNQVELKADIAAALAAPTSPQGSAHPAA